MSGEATLEEVRHALLVLADWMVIHPEGRAALPIYQRLEREEARLAASAAAWERAMKRRSEDAGHAGYARALRLSSG